MDYAVFSTKKSAADKNNLEQATELVKSNIKCFEESYDVYKINRIGRMLEVEAYYHEVDEYYRCIGFEIDIQSAFTSPAGDKINSNGENVGFYTTWIGKSHKAAPFTFEESYQPFGEAHRFSNGLGDHADVIKVLATAEEVQNAYKKL